MGLFDALSGVLNPDIISTYNDIINNHAEAFQRWKGRQIVGTLSELYWNKPTFKDKKYIAQHKYEILQIETEIADEKVYNKRRNQVIYTAYQYPHAFFALLKKLSISSIPNFNYSLPGNRKSNRAKRLEVELCDKNRADSQAANYVESIPLNNVVITNKVISTSTSNRSLENLSKEEYEKIHPHLSTLSSEESRILQQLKEEDYQIRFEDEILDNKKRAKYYKLYLASQHKTDSNIEFCVTHITELDNYIQQSIHNEYLELCRKYPNGVQYCEDNEVACGQQKEEIVVEKGSLLPKWEQIVDTIEYPEIVNVKVRSIDYYEFQREDEDGNPEFDEETGTPIIERYVDLNLADEIDGILDEDHNFAIGKINKLRYSAYYLREAIAACSKKIRIQLANVEMKYGIKTLSKMSLIAAFEGVDIVVKRTFHPKGEIYVDKFGVKRERQVYYFERDILAVNMMPEDIKTFVDALAEEVKQHVLQVLQELFSCVYSWHTLLGQFHYTYLLNYYPTTCDIEATEDEWNDRWTIWNFKNTPGKIPSKDHQRALEIVIPQIKSKLISTFGTSGLNKLTLVCIPASSADKTKARYEEFSNRICHETGMVNAYNHLQVISSSEEKKFGGKGITTNNVFFDEKFFSGKYVLLFDDVITKGESMLRFKRKMEELGAVVIGGMSIGKTKHNRV